MRRFAFALLAGCALSGAAARASANGRYPAAQHVLVGPGASGSSIVLRNTFGFLLSRDGGESFGWICEGALQYAGEFDPPFALDAASRIHVGLYDGLVRLSSDSCGVERLSVFDGLNVVDLDNHPSGETILALSVTPFVSGGPPPLARVHRSNDAGDGYVLVGSIEGALLETLEHAPSLPSRVYLAGATAPPSRPVVYRSDDGGQTVEETPFAWPSDVERLYVAAIDPSDHDVVYLRGSLAPSSGKSTAIFRSTDGGASYEELLRTTGPALGFAVSSDGATVWVGSTTEGLQRSSDGGDSFALVDPGQVRCLRHHEGALYVCGGPPQGSPMLGRSTDGGQRVEALVASCELDGALACGDPSSPVSACAASWPQVESILPCIAETTSSSVGAGGSGPGASSSTAGGAAAAGGAGGADGADRAPDGGCGCALVGSRVDACSRDVVLAALLGSVLALARRRRRARP